MARRIAKARITPLFSECDSDLLSHKWRKNMSGYAQRAQYGTRKDGTKGTLTFLAHREVLARKLGRALASDEICDHLNLDKLDNRRENLACVTIKENSRRRSLNSNNVSGFRGVCFNKDSRRWQAIVKTDGKSYYLGLFDSPELAGAAAEEKRKELGFPTDMGPAVVRRTEG